MVKVVMVVTAVEVEVVAVTLILPFLTTRVGQAFIVASQVVQRVQVAQEQMERQEHKVVSLFISVKEDALM